MPTINVALIGQGFMGRSHSNAWGQVAKFFKPPIVPVMHSVFGQPEENPPVFAHNWGWKNASTDWEALVKSPEIGLVDVVTPNYMHAPVAKAAIAAGKPVACEKPIAGTLADAREMVEAAKKAKVKTFVWFNYRRCPAVALAHQLVKQGKIGQIRHVRAAYLQDWAPEIVPLLWRFDKKLAGSGAHGDLNAHIVDITRFVTGEEITEVVGAIAETFAETGKVEPVGIDDACLFLAIFANGSMGTLVSTRYARGRKNYNTFEINGELGAIHFNLENPHLLDYFRYADPKTGAKIEDHLPGWQSIHVTNFEHPYMKNWWVPGCTIGYEHTFINQLADFLASLEGGPKFQPDFRAAMRTQAVCDAVLDSARKRQWVEIPENP